MVVEDNHIVAILHKFLKLRDEDTSPDFAGSSPLILEVLE